MPPHIFRRISLPRIHGLILPFLAHPSLKLHLLNLGQHGKFPKVQVQGLEISFDSIAHFAGATTGGKSVNTKRTALPLPILNNTEETKEGGNVE